MPALSGSSKIETMKDVYNLEVRLSKQEDGLWRAEVPSLPGCFVDGESVKEVMQDIQACAAMALDIRLEQGKSPSELGAVAGETLHLRVPVVVEEHWFRRPKGKTPRQHKSAALPKS